MSDNNNTAPNEILPFNVWFFGSIWVVLHIVANFLVDYLPQYFLPGLVSFFADEFIEPGNISYFAYGLLLGLVTGILIGTMQWYLINYYIEWPKAWITATVIGSVLSAILLGILGTLMSPGSEAFIFLVAGLGGSLLVAVAQWFVLRELVDYAYLWVVVGILSGFVASFAVNLLYYSGLMRRVILSGYDWQVSQIVSQIVNETIMVSCLIGLLYITLKRNSEPVT